MKSIMILSLVCIRGYEINRKSKGVRSDIQFGKLHYNKNAPMTKSNKLAKFVSQFCDLLPIKSLTLFSSAPKMNV